MKIGGWVVEGAGGCRGTSRSGMEWAIGDVFLPLPPLPLPLRLSSWTASLRPPPLCGEIERQPRSPLRPPLTSPPFASHLSSLCRETERQALRGARERERMEKERERERQRLEMEKRRTDPLLSRK